LPSPKHLPCLPSTSSQVLEPPNQITPSLSLATTAHYLTKLIKHKQAFAPQHGACAGVMAPPGVPNTAAAAAGAAGASSATGTVAGNHSSTPTDTEQSEIKRTVKLKLNGVLSQAQEGSLQAGKDIINEVVLATNKLRHLIVLFFRELFVACADQKIKVGEINQGTLASFILVVRDGKLDKVGVTGWTAKAKWESEDGHENKSAPEAVRKIISELSDKYLKKNVVDPTCQLNKSAVGQSLKLAFTGYIASIRTHYECHLEQMLGKWLKAKKRTTPQGPTEQELTEQEKREQEKTEREKREFTTLITRLKSKRGKRPTINELLDSGLRMRQGISQDAKGFEWCPQTQLSVAFVTLDGTAIQYIVNTLYPPPRKARSKEKKVKLSAAAQKVENALKREKARGRLFDMNKVKKLRADTKGWCFSGTIQTDGYAIGLIFDKTVCVPREKPAPFDLEEIVLGNNRRSYTSDEVKLEADTLPPDTTFVAIDPGVR
jgi:hypothetical protein